MARPLREGGIKAGPLRAITFFIVIIKFQWPLSSLGWAWKGVKALMAWPFVEELFCGFP